MSELATILSPAQDYDLVDRAGGVLLGAAIADAMGWITEFMRGREHMLKVTGQSKLTGFVHWEKPTGGRFFTYIDYIQPGEYSDDTQLSLCIARSMRVDGTVDNEYFARHEMTHWLLYSRGAGRTITAAAKTYQSRADAPWWQRCFALAGYTQAGGNGGAMRVAPIGIACAGVPVKAANEALVNAAVTHGHPRALMGAALQAGLVASLLRTSRPTFSEMIAVVDELLGQKPWDILPEGWLKRWGEMAQGRFETAWLECVAEARHKAGIVADMRKSREVRSDRETALNRCLVALGCYDRATKGSGLGTFFAALLLSTTYKEYREVVLGSINRIGLDTDTVGAMAASLSCASNGLGEIPEAWVVEVQDFGYLFKCSAELLRIGEPELTANPLRPERVKDAPAEASIDRILTSHRAKTGQLAVDPMLGRGFVRNVEAGLVGRPRIKGTMFLLRVNFETGQSCKFKHFLSELPQQPQSRPSRPRPAAGSAVSFERRVLDPAEE